MVVVPALKNALKAKTNIWKIGANGPSIEI